MSYQFGHVDRDERIDLAADEPVGETTRWSGLPTPLVTAAVMAVFAGALWFAYHEGTRHPAQVAIPAPPPAATAASDSGAPPGTLPPGAATAPLIRANPQPIKIKPENPGGMSVPEGDRLIYGERPGGPPVERLLPPPEQPMPRPAPPAPRTAALPAPSALPPTRLAPDEQARSTSRPAPAQTLPAEPGRKPLAAAPAARHAPATAPIREVRGGRYRVRLASLRTPDQARIEWQRLKRLYPELLGKLTANAVRDDAGERGVWYQIVAGGFSDAATAKRLCHELKERHQGCSIVR